MAKVTKKSNSEQEIIIQKITISPIVRSSQDIQKWRSALQSAEATIPIRVPLYDLYEDILLDPVLSSMVDKRVLGVTKTKLAYIDENGMQVPEIMTLIGTRQFRALRKELLLSKVWGHSLCELAVKDGIFQIFPVPRKHVLPIDGKIVYAQYGTDGINYREDPYRKYLVEVGNVDDLGLLLRAAPYVIYKRGSFGDWANFAQIFGMPFREARYDGYNPTVRAQLEMALEAAGSASYAILPKEAEITFREASNTQGTGELYNTLRKACNEEIMILMLGQTETTTSSASSGYAQSKIHAETEDDLNLNDRLDELGWLNETVKPILENIGYKVGNGSFKHLPNPEQLSLKDKATVLVQIKSQLRTPIDDDYIYKEFGIPKPENYEAMKKGSYNF